MFSYRSRSTGNVGSVSSPKFVRSFYDLNYTLDPWNRILWICFSCIIAALSAPLYRCCTHGICLMSCSKKISDTCPLLFSKQSLCIRHPMPFWYWSSSASESKVAGLIEGRSYVQCVGSSTIIQATSSIGSSPKPLTSFWGEGAKKTKVWHQKKSPGF